MIDVRTKQGNGLVPKDEISKRNAARKFVPNFESKKEISQTRESFRVVI